MTASPSPRPQGRSQPRLRVLSGRGTRRPRVAPWAVFTVIVVVSFIGIVLARTTLDSGAFELNELTARIEEARRENDQLALDVARLESPARIGPLAEQAGLVFPETRTPLFVESVPEDGSLPREALAAGSRP